MEGRAQLRSVVGRRIVVILLSRLANEKSKSLRKTLHFPELRPPKWVKSDPKKRLHQAKPMGSGRDIPVR
jgi:hypothetical protein